ncbi:hypothetical protein GCM10009555_073510 [Acrocarpospora macrocephala]|uniref:Mannitol-specific phosphotransferase enzyme IIA component n=1 Tax=Acrocarpospora macrocephala TaxID=150177 RepID=A0A5M3X7Z9_9ACTN|nr:PTS sugar transporter subunit IIA [Acrocarpospora macrocephala]GES16299.1 hypothetical protein Amac_098970 [Acrocarpospora macrocephala]
MAEGVLDRRAVHLKAVAVNREDAIRQCGQALLAVGAVREPYLVTMLEREQSISTYVGEGVAIPHGTLAGKDAVLRDALSFLRFPDGVDWGGERVTICIGIAATGDRHVAVLAELAEILLDPDRARVLRETAEVDEVIAILGGGA